MLKIWAVYLSFLAHFKFEGYVRTINSLHFSIYVFVLICWRYRSKTCRYCCCLHNRKLVY